MAQGFGRYVGSSSKRVSLLKLKLKEYKYTKPDDIMMTIMEVFRDGDFVPDVGKYYTFIYSAKTKGLRYDEFPLIATLSIEDPTHFTITVPAGTVRNYTWFEVNSKLLEIKKNEIDYLRSLPYAKIRTK